MEADAEECTFVALPMPRYRSHKIVSALKIDAVEFYADGSAKIASEGYLAFKTRPSFRERFKGGSGPDGEPVDLGYFVEYPDGYQSWSPSQAFDEGYTLVSRHGEPSPEDQIQRLAQFIMDEIDGEPSQSEGAVECAIRLLRGYTAVASCDKPQPDQPRG